MSPGQLYACAWYGRGCNVQLWTGHDGKCPGCGRTGIPLKPKGYGRNHRKKDPPPRAGES